MTTRPTTSTPPAISSPRSAPRERCKAALTGFDPDRVRHFLAAVRTWTQDGIYPPSTQVEQTIRTLRGFVTSMSPYAEVRSNRLEPESDAWRVCRAAIDRAKRVQASGPGAGLRSATEHARVLAGAVEDLLRHAEQYQEKA